MGHMYQISQCVEPESCCESLLIFATTSTSLGDSNSEHVCADPLLRRDARTLLEEQTALDASMSKTDTSLAIPVDKIKDRPASASNTSISDRIVGGTDATPGRCVLLHDLVRQLKCNIGP